MISQVRKRDGTVVPFDISRIENAIKKAFLALKKDPEPAKKLAREVVNRLEKAFPKAIPSVEDIQDIVELVLMEKYPEVARAYIVYRRERARVRQAKRFFGVYDDLKLSVNAIKVLERRYLLKDDGGRVIETPRQMFARVAHHVALADKRYNQDWERSRMEFYRMMVNLQFLPNSPTLMNAGTSLGQLSACFVLPIEDSLESIFDTLKYTALIHQSGGGTGFNFSHLRPKGDIVRSTKGVASGPVSFMEIFDKATDVIKQGGRRRGANMGILNYNHPDIVEFITAKAQRGRLTNFNISVGVDGKFMKALKSGKSIELINPRNGKEMGEMDAREIFDLITTQAWATGDPGMIFFDTINKKSPHPDEIIEATNPCGEQPLLPFESCNLGSINVAKFVEKGDINWERLGDTVERAIHFLDNVIDINRFPLPQIATKTLEYRKVGLGVMGFAEALILLGIRYDSKEGVSFGERLMHFISERAREKSKELGEIRGSFPAFEKTIWSKQFGAMRNTTVTTIAPTGSISIIAGTTSGIEPLFAVAYVRKILGGTTLLEVNQAFEKLAKERGFYSKDLMLEIARTGSIQNIDGIPDDVKEIVRTALDIDPEWHVKMQAAFQKHTDNAVSKTINMRPEASIDDVKRAYHLAYRLGCKGITVYRYGSKGEQVLYVGPLLKGELEKYVSVASDYAGGCPGSVCVH